MKRLSSDRREDATGACCSVLPLRKAMNVPCLPPLAASVSGSDETRGRESDGANNRISE